MASLRALTGRVRHGGPERFLVPLAAVALLALVVRLTLTLTVLKHVPLRNDSLSYHDLGYNLAHGFGYVRPPQMNPPIPGLAPAATAEFPPLFPGLLALFTVLGAGSTLTQKLLLCGVGTGTVVLIGLVGRRIFTPTIGILAAVIAAVHPLIFQPDGVLMSESLYMCLVAGVLLAAVVAVAHPDHWWRWAVLGALIGLASLTRAEGLLFVVLLALPLALRFGGRAWRQRAVAGAVVVAATVLVVAPWTIRNAVRFSQFVPVSNNPGSVALGANCRSAYHGRQLGSWDFACIAVTASIEGRDAVIAPGVNNEAQVYSRWRTLGYRYATDHAGRVPAVVGARVLRTWGMWNPTTEIRFDVMEARDHTLQTIGYWLGLALLPFAVLGAVVGWRQRRSVWILIAPAALATIVSIVGFGSTRTRAVAEPALAILAAAGLVAAWSFAAARRRRGTPRLPESAAGDGV